MHGIAMAADGGFTAASGRAGDGLARGVSLIALLNAKRRGRNARMRRCTATSSKQLENAINGTTVSTGPIGLITRTFFTRGKARLEFGMHIGLLVIALFLGSVGAADPSLSQPGTQPFNPIRELTTWYTDRSLVDIEVIGSTSMLPERHRLEPERLLRFRLERAYVVMLLARKPGFEIVTLTIDMDTGLAESLITAVSQAGRFHEDIPGVPSLSQVDAVRRTLRISLQSDQSAASLRRLSDGLMKCRGAPPRDGLSAYEWEGRSGCSRPSYPNASRFVGAYDNDLLIQIECRDESFSGLGCDLRFPFEAFGAEIGFHRDQLPKWREMIDRASAFLKSKQYR